MRSEGPLVTIGVAVYNGARYIIDTLNSIRNQTYLNIELYIIDDGSSDESYELCTNWALKSKFPVFIIRNVTNMGLTKTCNIILNKASGKYLQLFGHDDIMLPGKIANDVEIFEQLDDDIALIYSKMILIDENGEFMNQEYNQRIGFDGLSGENVFIELIKNNFIPAPTVILRTQVIRKNGGYDESLIFEDWDMWLRITRNYGVFFSQVTNVYYRIHPQSMMSRKGLDHQIMRNEANIKMIKKHLGHSKEYDKVLYNKLRELFIYSYFLGDKIAAQNLHWYLLKKFDVKVWLYHKLASLGIKHPSKYNFFFAKR